MQGVELNYSAIEKQKFVVIKTLKHFRAYTKIIVLYLVVRQLLIQREVGEKGANWVTALQEYDVGIQLLKLLWVEGFAGCE